MCCQNILKAKVKVPEDCAITMLRRAVMTMDPPAFVTAFACVPGPSSVAGQLFDSRVPPAQLGRWSEVRSHRTMFTRPAGHGVGKLDSVGAVRFVGPLGHDDASREH